MKTTISCIILLLFGLAAAGQSKTTQALHEENEDALALFFYKNTLRMINQTESKEFDELIKDVEKMKFLIVNKAESKFNPGKFKSLINDYTKEGYEAIMTSRMDGRNFDIYLKEKDGKTAGTVVLVNDVDDLYVLDILGSIPVSKVPQFFQTIDQSSEIGKMIKNFSDQAEKKHGDSKKNDDN